MSSSSKSSNSTKNSTTDRRQAVSDEAIAIQNSGGDVTVNQVADEAWDLGELAIREVSDVFGQALKDTQTALYRTQDAARTESAQLAEQVIKIGIPAAALAYVIGKVWK